MSAPLNLTGRWTGHYQQHDQQHPITARFTQAGNRLSGSMRDDQPEDEYSLFDLAARAGLPPGADEQIEAKLRELVPEAPAVPIRWVSRLPAESVLEGRCDGQAVSFVKSYQGTSFGGYKLGEQFVGVQKAGHAVHYEGRLSPDGSVIEGRWWIDADSESGGRRLEGSFSLRRAEGDVPSAPGQAPSPERQDRPWWRIW
jgi:hypothetical protein